MSPEVMRLMFPKTLPWRIARWNEAVFGLMFWWLPGGRK